jgi:transcription elongation factor GreA
MPTKKTETKKIKPKTPARTQPAISEIEEIILTPEGLRHVQEELEHLRENRKEVLERVKAALQFGEPMENSELEEAKAEQAAVDGRIQELQRLLSSATVLEAAKDDGRVHVGRRVKVQDVDRGEETVYQIVGAMEADPVENRISNLSPMGQALLGRKPKDKVKVSTPNGECRYIILSVE